MELIRGDVNIRSGHRGCVASIGNFDGVHLGHRAIIRQLQLRSREFNQPGLVIVFEPQPQEYFRGASAPPRLSSLRDKIRTLAELGVERLLCLRFHARMAGTGAREFIEQLLIERLGVRHLVVGDDFRFGNGREGDFRLLQEYGSDRGFSVESADTFVLDGERVSSSRIRGTLAEGDLEAAAALLGRHYALSGRVIHGDKRGRQWGFATANIDMSRRRPALTGVYVVRAGECGQSGVHRGVASLGTRPMIASNRTLLEVHLLDFDRDIYGKRIDVEFVKKLRDEQRFDGIEGLKRQIKADVEEARSFFQGGQ